MKIVNLAVISLHVLLFGALAAENTNVPPKRKAYVLVANDVIELKVYQEDDLGAKARIAPDGTVTLPLIGTVEVAGKTVDQAAERIKAVLAADYLVNPQVSLSIAEFAKRRFTILGQVQHAGAFDFPGDETINLLQAIALAGGYTRIGSPSKITLQRMVNGEKKVFKLDAEAMSKDERAKSFEILPDDTITVGEKLL